MTMDIEEHAVAIYNKYKDDIDISKEELVSNIKQKKKDFGFDNENAAKTVEQQLISTNDIPNRKTKTECKEVVISDITEEEKWINTTGIVTSLWEPSHENIKYVGLLEDQTSVMKFVVWEQALPIERKGYLSEEEPLLEEGNRYLIKDAITKQFNDHIELKINKESSIEKFESNIDLGYEMVHGIITGIDTVVENICKRKCQVDECDDLITVYDRTCTEHQNKHVEPEPPEEFIWDIECIITTNETEETLQTSLSIDSYSKLIGVDSEEIKNAVEESYLASELNHKMDDDEIDEIINKLKDIDKQIIESAKDIIGSTVGVHIKENSHTNGKKITRVEKNPPEKSMNINDTLVKARELKASIKDYGEDQ